MPGSSSFLLRWLLPVAVVLWFIGLAVWKGTAPTRQKPLPLPSLSEETLAARAQLLPLPAVRACAIPGPATWEMPMGGKSGAFTYNAQPFAEPNPRRGGLHLGDDLNGIGQENTDLGDPVFAAADGLVAYAGTPDGGWGGVVILLHQTPEGTIQSLYGHLDSASIAVTAGEIVPRGRRLGRLGLSSAMDYAHLHLELRQGLVVAPGAGYAEGSTLDRLDPRAFLSRRVQHPLPPAARSLDRAEFQPKTPPSETKTAP